MMHQLLRVVHYTVLTFTLLLGVFITFGAIPAYYSEFDKDHSVANVKAMLMVGAGISILFLGAAILPRLRTKWRVGVLVTPVVLLGVFLALFECTGVSGEMLPVFRFRWLSSEPPLWSTNNIGSANSDRQERTDSAFTSTYDLSKLNFRQFLGENRNATAQGIEIEDNWSDVTPEILWKHSIGSGWSGLAIVGHRIVTQEQLESDGKSEEAITCYNLFTGDLLWRHSYASKHDDALGGLGPRATPLVSENAVFWHGATGVVGKLNLHDGKLQWQISLLEKSGISEEESLQAVPWGRSASPLKIGERLIVPLGGTDISGRSLIAIDQNDGSIVWKNGVDQIGYASPVYTRIAGIEQILSMNEQSLTSHSPENGSTLWTFEWPGSSSGMANISQPVSLGDNRVLLTKGYGVGAAMIKIDAESNNQQMMTATQVWSNESVLKTKFTIAVVKDGHAFGLSDGILECIELQSGQRKWKQGRFGHGQILLVGQHLLVLAENGRIILVDADPNKFHQLGSCNVLDGTTWNTPAIAGPFLVVRNAAEIACVRLSLLNESDFHIGEGN